MFQAKKKNFSACVEVDFMASSRQKERQSASKNPIGRGSEVAWRERKSSMDTLFQRGKTYRKSKPKKVFAYLDDIKIILIYKFEEKLN